MTNGLVFVLHGPAEARFAADLAAALSPMIAMPMQILADRQTAYGSGAICIVALDHDLAARPQSVANSAPLASTIICRGSGVVLPAQLASYSSVDAQPTLEATVAVLSDAIARKQALAAEGATRSRRTTPSLAKRGSEVRETGKHSMVVRSAWGLAATMAVASIAAPAIGGRAGAMSVSTEPDPTNLANAASTGQAAATLTSTQAAEEPELEPVETPQLIQLLDHYDRVERTEPETVVAYAPEAVASNEAPYSSFETASPVSLSVEPSVTIAVSAGAPKQASAPVVVADAMQAQQQPATVTLKPAP